MTSAHESKDDRIFLREAVSAVNAGYETYIVAQGKTFISSGVTIKGIGQCKKNRFQRMLLTTQEIYLMALEIDADIYQFHDPELLPIGLKLRKKGKEVIYDSHEDVPRQIMAKEWIPKFLRKIVSFLFEKYEKGVARRLSCVIAATPHIAQKFIEKGVKTQVVRNYPLLNDIQGHNEDYLQRESIACYAGGLTKIRGITDIVEASVGVPIKILLAGDIEDDYKTELSMSQGFSQVELLGYLDRTEIEEIYNKSRIGMCVLQKTPNHVNALAIKLFEYMAAGIPIICSNFPLWVEIVAENKCGICVEPQNIGDIREAIHYLLKNPEQAKQMGDNGKRIVRDKYNWEIEKHAYLECLEMLKD